MPLDKQAARRPRLAGSGGSYTAASARRQIRTGACQERATLAAPMRRKRCARATWAFDHEPVRPAHRAVSPPDGSSPGTTSRARASRCAARSPGRARLRGDTGVRPNRHLDAVAGEIGRAHGRSPCVLGRLWARRAELGALPDRHFLAWGRWNGEVSRQAIAGRARQPGRRRASARELAPAAVLMS